MHCKACPGSLMDDCSRDGCAFAASDDLAPHLALLDVEEGSIVVVRTRSKLTATKAARWQDGLERLLRAQGYREVGVLILDDCAEVTVEKAARPDTRMAHQALPTLPVTRCC